MTELVPLDTTEADVLADAEQTIRNGLHTFVEVGRALARIRDGRLYRQTHTTFETYCEQEYGLTRKRAYDLMGAAETVEALSPNGDTPIPSTESQARELSGLDVGTAAEVMHRASESGDKITAASIRAARNVIAPRPQPTPEPAEEFDAQAVADQLAASDADIAARTRAPTPDPVVTDYLANDPKAQDIEYLRRFLSAVGKSHDLLMFDADRLADLLADVDLDSLHRHSTSLTTFVDTIRRRRSGLRLIGGTK